jgi:hypothetical protein
LLVLALGLLPILACTGSEAPKTQKPEAARPAPETKAETTGESGDEGIVLMMGRSVMGGWFGHWTGGSGATSVRRDGHTLRYVEISTPPEIADSAAQKLAETKGKPVVFFKFCFDDFAGGSREEAAASLAEKKKYVGRVYEAVVRKRGLTLIVGNALPRVKEQSDRWLVWNHREFNEWLSGFAADHEGEVIIFDFYDVLSAPDGSLKAGYATNPEDSHPNDAAYKALDKPFAELLAGL